MDPTPQIDQDLNALTFLINASFNKPPTGYLWIPPLYAPSNSITVFHQESEGQLARAGDIFKVIFSWENEDGEIVVITQGLKIWDLGSEFAKENPLWAYLMGIWAPEAIWWDRIGLWTYNYETEVSLEGYLAGLDRSSLTALELAVLEGRHGEFPTPALEAAFNGDFEEYQKFLQGQKGSNGFNILPWALGALGFGVGGAVGAPVGFLVGQMLSRTPKTEEEKQADIRAGKIAELTPSVSSKEHYMSIQGRGR